MPTLLYSGFYLPSPVDMTSWKHRANSRDPRARGRVPRVQVPAIPQHGKGTNCLDRPWDNRPPLPSLLAQQEKTLWLPSHLNGISLQHFRVSSAEMHQMKHLALSESLALRFPHLSPGNPLLKCSMLLGSEVTCLFLQP